MFSRLLALTTTVVVALGVAGSASAATAPDPPWVISELGDQQFIVAGWSSKRKNQDVKSLVNRWGKPTSCNRNFVLWKFPRIVANFAAGKTLKGDTCWKRHLSRRVTNFLVTSPRDFVTDRGLSQASPYEDAFRLYPGARSEGGGAVALSPGLAAQWALFGPQSHLYSLRVDLKPVSSAAPAPKPAAQLPTAGDVAELLRTGPGTVPRVAEWADRCGSLTGEECASYLDLQPRWGRFRAAPGPSVLAMFSTGNTLGSSGVAVVTRLASGELKLQIPQSVRVQSARFTRGRLRLVIDRACRVPPSDIATFGHPRLQWYRMRGDTIVPSGKRARCRR